MNWKPASDFSSPPSVRRNLIKPQAAKKKNLSNSKKINLKGCFWTTDWVWHQHRCFFFGLIGGRKCCSLPVWCSPAAFAHGGFCCSSSGSCWTWSRWRRRPRTRWPCRGTSRPCSSTCVWCSSPGCWASTTPWRRSRSWQWCGSWCWDIATGWSLVRKTWNTDQTWLSPLWSYPSPSLGCGSFYFFSFQSCILRINEAFLGNSHSLFVLWRIFFFYFAFKQSQVFSLKCIGYICGQELLICKFCSCESQFFFQQISMFEVPQRPLSDV